ncbi:hypothetical protein DPMN_037682 [Dreissena polymorpha]|uniref:Uncharacterized protein n=1 Tax=Dreissena polymorpha TaxID=45954 RepID=A0A9D4RPE8_DREPO|nr:hypothetical protein DPMN_037682 [Dreissena polymorpha]
MIDFTASANQYSFDTPAVPTPGVYCAVSMPAKSQFLAPATEAMDFQGTEASTYKTSSNHNQHLVQAVYTTTDTKSLPSPATPTFNSHSTHKTSNSNTFSAKLDGETAFKSILCDSSNQNINVLEKKPARDRPRDSRSLSRAEKRSESAKPYTRQGSKSRKCSQNISSQSMSSKNSKIYMSEPVHGVSVGGICADQGQPNCGIK